ncbi:unnamed protein product, partial [Oppiella nova]
MSVVSASSEPDTIRLSVNIESNSLSKRRHITGIVDKVIGQKKTIIKLSESGGTVEEEIEDQNSCCISDEDVYRLGDLGLIIQSHYGNTRDIEWGLFGGQIFMLQSRPVTNLDNSYTDYEIMHEIDTAHPTEFEIYSRAHWGENYPGASTCLVFSFLWANKSSIFREVLDTDPSATMEDYNPYIDFMGCCYNQLFFNLTNYSFARFYDYPESKSAEYAVLAFFGHHITDKDVLQMFRERRQYVNKPKLWPTLKYYANIFLFGRKTMFNTLDKHMGKYDMAAKLRQYSGAKQVFAGLMKEYVVTDVMFFNHSWASQGSTIKNGILRYILETAQKDNPNLEIDFNSMISSCDEVISAEVPNRLREIAISIRDKEGFRQLSDEKALEMLQKGTDEASQLFKEFLQIHGHRGYKEMDPYHKPWEDNPIPCIKNIKGILTGGDTFLKPKVIKTVDEVVNELRTPLSFWRRYLLRKVFLPWSRKGVGYREVSKGFMVWFNHRIRKGFRYLAQTMVSEGLIPSIDTFFFLTIDEIERLCNGDRDALLLSKTRLRRRLFTQMDRYKFEEIIKGPEMRPKNFEDSIRVNHIKEGSLQLSGTPVSLGTVKARVCVAEDIIEADNIQPGDILITYSTDIGWSPYFPLLSG